MTTELSIFGGNGDLIAAFNRQRVRFLVVGGLAVHLYVPDREPDDLDLLIDPVPDNADCIFRAFAELHLVPRFSSEELTKPKKHMNLKSYMSYYADVVTPEPGIDFHAEWENSRTATVNGHLVRMASPDLLIRMKSGTGRPKDLADIELLSRLARDT
jgi:hypothetical protein